MLSLDIITPFVGAVRLEVLVKRANCGERRSMKDGSGQTGRRDHITRFAPLDGILEITPGFVSAGTGKSGITPALAFHRFFPESLLRNGCRNSLLQNHLRRSPCQPPGRQPIAVRDFTGWTGSVQLLRCWSWGCTPGLPTRSPRFPVWRGRCMMCIPVRWSMRSHGGSTG